MRIKIGEISQSGLDVEASLADDWARKAAADALDAEVQALEFSARIELVSDCMRVRGRLMAEFHRDCDRCQTPLKVKLSGEMDLFYSPPRPGETGDRDLDSGDMDIGWFDGSGLEISQVIAEQLAIWCPVSVCCEADQSNRLEPSDSPCEVLAHEGGPEPKRESPFADLRLPE